AGAAQTEHVQAVEPTALFLRLLTATLASGRAHVAGPNGREPASPEAWGWRGKEYTHAAAGGGPPETEIGWLAQGRRIGRVDGADLYLGPEASYAAAQELARDQGDGLPIYARTLHRRLRERGLLASWDRCRQRNTVRRALEGVKQREVLYLHADLLS